MIRATSNVLTTPTIKILLQLIFPPIHTFSVQYQNSISYQRTLRKINIAINCISHILYKTSLQWARAVHIVHCCTVAVALCTVVLLPHCCFAAIHCVLLHCCRYILYFCTVALVVVASSPLSHSGSCPISRFSRLVPKLFTEPALLTWFSSWWWGEHILRLESMF